MANDYLKEIYRTITGIKPHQMSDQYFWERISKLAAQKELIPCNDPFEKHKSITLSVLNAALLDGNYTFARELITKKIGKTKNFDPINDFYPKDPKAYVRSYFYPPLFTAVSKNANLEIVNLLVNNGAEVVIKNHRGETMTPLPIAARNGNLAIVNLLYEKATKNQPNQHYEAFINAAMGTTLEHFAVVRTLSNRPKDDKFPNKWQETLETAYIQAEDPNIKSYIHLLILQAKLDKYISDLEKRRGQHKLWGLFGGAFTKDVKLVAARALKDALTQCLTKSDFSSLTELEKTYPALLQGDLSNNIYREIRKDVLSYRKPNLEPITEVQIQQHSRPRSP